MIGTLKSLVTTLKIAFRRPFTLEYPTEQPLLAPRFMAHPVLTWDGEVDEPYCTGCLVCMLICPTDCITVSMKDNPKFEAKESTRRKIVDDFELNFADCIMCGLCVEYCNFDAIIMSDHFDASGYSRAKLVQGLDDLLDEGREQEAKGRWSPPTVKKSQRRAAAQGRGPADAGETAVEESATSAAAPSSDDRVAAARARATALRAQKAAERGEAPPAEPTAPSAPTAAETSEKPVDPRVAEARQKAAEFRAQRAAERGEAPPADPTAPSVPTADETSEKPVDPRVAEARQKAAEFRAQKAAERGEAPPAEPTAPPTSTAAETSEKPVDPRVAEARQKAAEFRAQKAREKAEQEADGKSEDSQKDGDAS